MLVFLQRLHLSLSTGFFKESIDAIIGELLKLLLKLFSTFLLRYFEVFYSGELKWSEINFVETRLCNGITLLKKSLFAYRGHLTRPYSDLEILFLDFNNLMEAPVKKNTLDGLFEKYNSRVMYSR